MQFLSFAYVCYTSDFNEIIYVILMRTSTLYCSDCTSTLIGLMINANVPQTNNLCDASVLV
jgi:hypothetical protein